MKKITLYICLFIVTLSTSQNNSLNFDGFEDTIELGQNFAFEPTDTFTLEAWVYLESNAGFQQVISKLGVEDDFFRGWGLQIRDDKRLSAYVSESFTINARFVNGTQVLENNEWYHVAMSFNIDNTISLYVNGVLEPLSLENYTGTITTLSTTATTQIGSYDGTDSPDDEFFKGNIDEVRIWDVARTSTEIADNYNTELSGTESNLIGYYKMDISNSSCDIQDCSVSQFQGTRSGNAGQNNLPQFSDNIPAIIDVECGSDSTCTLSVDEVALENFIIAPNPGKAFVSLIGVNIVDTEITMYNALGARVNTFVLVNNNMDVSNLAKGVYFIKIRLGNNEVTKKLIVN